MIDSSGYFLNNCCASFCVVKIKNVTYQSKWVVTLTSERVCPINNDASGRLCYLQIGIDCNIVIATAIYITSATSVTLRFWLIFIRAQHPELWKCVCERSFYWLFYCTQQRVCHICFYWIFSCKQQSAHHICCWSMYWTASLVKIRFYDLFVSSYGER